MKQIFLVPALILTLGLNVAAEDQKSEAPMDPKVQEAMKKYEAAATPGDAHKVLTGIAGNWKTTAQMWHTPDSKPETSKGTASFKSILGGCWLQQDYKGKTMGKPFQGLGIIGYDNVKQKYETHWFDSMSTWSLKTEGDYDTAAKTFKDKGSSSCPISESKVQEVRSDWEIVSKNKMVFSMYGKNPVFNTPEFKMMEIVYTR